MYYHDSHKHQHHHDQFCSNSRQENFYHVKTKDQTAFIRKTMLHYQDWKKTEVCKYEFDKYVERNSKVDKKTGSFQVS